MKRIREFILVEEGAELAEYAVGVALLVAIAIVVYNVLGVAVNTKMNKVANDIQK
jgi:Flp pilus assembly pilin Flp